MKSWNQQSFLKKNIKKLVLKYTKERGLTFGHYYSLITNKYVNDVRKILGTFLVRETSN